MSAESDGETLKNDSCLQVKRLSWKYCSKKEQNIRTAEKQRLISQKKLKMPVVTVCFKFEKNENRKTKATVSYVLDKGKSKIINASNLDGSETFDLTERYVASYVKRLQKHAIDSLLSLSGFDSTENFHFYHS